MRSHRRPRAAVAYRRRGPTRQPYDLVLIVCEGQKTEPNYLQALRATYALSSVNIRIISPSASDPLSIVKFAIREIRDSEYDRAFCVFDRDQHTNFDQAIGAIQQSRAGKAGRLIPITSTPCFELWLLLHFRYSNAPFTRTGNNSACDMAINELKAHFPDYTKGRRTVFMELTSRIEGAINNAKRLEKDNETSGSNNPATQIHALIHYLMNVKK